MHVLIATDADKRQLAPIFERLSRAGVHNAEIRPPKGEADPLADIHNVRTLAMVMKDGVVIDHAKLPLKPVFYKPIPKAGP